MLKIEKKKKNVNVHIWERFL